MQKYTTMSPPIFFLILPSTTALPALLPPKPLRSPQIPTPNQQPPLHFPLLKPKTSRRDATVFLSLIAVIPSLFRPSRATAFSIGISGPKDWLREQKKKSSRFLLAPIDASRNSLQAAYLLLSSESAEKDQEEVQKLLKSAARDCVPQDRNSFVAFQSNTGVEVCTFRLVLNNASSLLADKDPIKLEAEAKLSDLVRSFSSLNSVANETGIQFGSKREKVADALVDAIASLNKFEQGIKDCLEI